jgi:3-methyladenine DNA glycosylase AlkD
MYDILKKQAIDKNFFSIGLIIVYNDIFVMAIYTSIISLAPVITKCVIMAKLKRQYKYNDAYSILKAFRLKENPDNIKGMARYGINVETAMGLSMPFLRDMAKETIKSHELAIELWDTGIHEARIFAAFIDDPNIISPGQMDKWVSEIDSWDICDTLCSNLFRKTPYAYSKCFEWADDEREYVKRAGYVMMAVLAVHDKKADDSKFLQFFPVILKGANDERNFVKKAVNWALRQVGKKNRELNLASIYIALQLKSSNNKAAKWIGSDALRELKSDSVRKKLGIL